MWRLDILILYQLIFLRQPHVSAKHYTTKNPAALLLGFLYAPQFAHICKGMNNIAELI